MQPLQDHQPQLEGKEVGEHDENSSSGLEEDDAAQHDAHDAVVSGIVLGAMEHLVGCDDDHAGEGTSHCTCLQDPVPPDLLRTLPKPQERGGPGREEKDGLSHQDTILQGRRGEKIIRVSLSSRPVKTKYIHTKET